MPVSRVDLVYRELGGAVYICFTSWGPGSIREFLGRKTYSGAKAEFTISNPHIYRRHLPEGLYGRVVSTLSVGVHAEKDNVCPGFYIGLIEGSTAPVHLIVYPWFTSPKWLRLWLAPGQGYAVAVSHLVKVSEEGKVQYVVPWRCFRMIFNGWIVFPRPGSYRICYGGAVTWWKGGPPPKGDVEMLHPVDYHEVEVRVQKGTIEVLEEMWRRRFIAATIGGAAVIAASIVLTRLR